MIEILPSTPVYTFAELEEKLSSVRGVTNFFQIDVTDGKFAGKPSWPLAKLDQNFESILREERGMPFWEDFDFEIDLMVGDPFSIAQDFIKAGASRVIFHAESINLDEDKILLDKIKSEGLVEVGIAVRSSTDDELIKELMEFADFFQVMTCNPIGVQGSPFDPTSLVKIKLIKSWNTNMLVAVDGAMNPETIHLAIEAGATRIAVGSYILKSDNPHGAYEEMQDIVRSYE